MTQTPSTPEHGEPPAHSTSAVAIATDDIQGIAEREVSSQLGGSDHRPVIIISINGQMQSHRNTLTASWSYNNNKAKQTNKQTTGMLLEWRWIGRLQH